MQNSNINNEFQLSEHGFLPQNNNSELPKGCDYFKSILENFSLDDGEKFREIVKSMPDYDLYPLKLSELSFDEKRFLYTLLSLAQSKYIYGCGMMNGVDTIPKAIGKPLVLLARELKMPIHVHIYPINWWSWTLKDSSKGMTPDNLKQVFIANDRIKNDCQNFFTHATAVEAAGGRCVPKMLPAKGLIAKKDDKNLIKVLLEMKENLQEMTNYMKKYPEVFNKDLFFDIVGVYGPTLNPAAFPEGVKYEGVEHEKISYGMINAGSGPLFQSFDIFFGLEHIKENRGYQVNNRKYFPEPHQRFLEELEKGPYLREYVKMSHNKVLVNLYNECLEKLNNFRRVHLHLFKEIGHYNIQRLGIPMEAMMEPGQRHPEVALMSYIKTINENKLENNSRPKMHREGNNLVYFLIVIALFFFMTIITASEL